MLSMVTVQSRLLAQPRRTNETLQQALHDKTLEVLHPSLAGWIAENHFHAADFKATIDACRDLIHRFPHSDWIDRAKALIGQSHLRLGDIDHALAAFEEAAAGDSIDAKNARLAHADLLERGGRRDEAAASYGHLLNRRPDDTDDSWRRRLEHVAERGIRRCHHESPPPSFKSPRDAAFRISKLLRERDFHGLKALASPTHFGWGISELSYDGFDWIAEDLERDLSCSTVLSDPMQLEGGGGSYSLVTTGWSGRVFFGRVAFQISEQPSGWQMTGVSFAGVPFMKKGGWPIGGGGGGPDYPYPDFSFKAPWPTGTCLRAGGLARYIESLTAPLIGLFIMIIDQFSDCGYGAYGLFYNEPPTHQGINQFAVDFTGYYRGFLWVTEIPVTPALAAHDGVVTFLDDRLPYGIKDKTGGNSIELDYLTPRELEIFLSTGTMPQGKITSGGAFRTRYLHLSPGHYVSRNMYVPQGMSMAYMDDSGNSGFPHLHFSIHARDYFVGTTPYYSIPLHNFDGQDLDAGSEGQCVCSSNDGPIMGPPP
jgi:hypothetical protein